MSNNRTPDIDQFAEVFAALSNPNRLRIYMRLLDCCGGPAACRTDSEASACVGELGHDVGVAPSTVSHHIKELRRAGLIHMERRGQKVECRVNGAALQDVVTFFAVAVEA
jgi:ArsR family transcriptional regulator